MSVDVNKSAVNVSLSREIARSPGGESIAKTGMQSCEGNRAVHNSKLGTDRGTTVEQNTVKQYAKP